MVLEQRPCLCALPGAPCPPGRVAGSRPCGKCGGTGQGTRGKAGGCKACYGCKTEPDFTAHVLCGQCHGSASVPETFCDSLPQELWRALAFQVFRVPREQTWNEQHLAVGFAWSSTDYGRAWQGADEELLARVRETTHRVQAVKVAKDDRQLCSFVAICLMPGGYTVRGVWCDAN